MIAKCISCDTKYNVHEQHLGKSFICKKCEKGVVYVPNPTVRNKYVHHSTCETCYWAEWAEVKMWEYEGEKVNKFIEEQTGIYEPKSGNDEVPLDRIEGECRRFPPKTIVDISSDLSDENKVSSSHYTAFPKIKTRHWCGEWKAKIEG